MSMLVVYQPSLYGVSGMDMPEGWAGQGMESQKDGEGVRVVEISMVVVVVVMRVGVVMLKVVG